MQEIDVINISTTNLRFILNTVLWDSFDTNIISIVSPPQIWSEVKMFTTGGAQNPQLTTIPNKMGGIYLLLVKPNILPESHVFLMYVGRAHISATQNLRKRCLEYPDEKKRPKIKRLIEQWGQYMYIRYLPLDDNDTIDAVEGEIINKILPPFNDVIPDQKISAAVKAFTM